MMMHGPANVKIMNIIFESLTVEPTCPVPHQIPMKSLNILGNVHHNTMFTVGVSLHESLWFVLTQSDTHTHTHIQSVALL